MHVAMGLIILLLLRSADASADGFRNPFQNGAANAQGNAFAAQADDASAVFYNPAAMTQLQGVQFVGGVEFVNVDTHFRNATGQKTENDLGGPFGMPPPMQFFITATPKDLGISWLGDMTLGFGLQNLFGFASRYPSNGPLQTAVTSASLPLLDLKPTLAYRFTDWLSLGVGADIFTFLPGVVGDAEQKFVSPGLPGIPPGARVKIDGRGMTAAFNTSALVTLLRNEVGAPRLNLAFVYRGQSDLPLNGALRVNGNWVAKSKSSLHFPDSYTTGIAVWPIRDHAHEWKIETDVDYVRWSTIRKLEFRFSNGVTLSTPQEWRDTFSVGTGTEYKWLKLAGLPAWDLALRAGYNHSRTPVPDKNFNPAFPDSNAHVLSVGLGMTCKPGGKFLGFKDCGDPAATDAHRKHIGIDMAYQAILLEPRTVTGNPNPAVNGKYRTINQALTLSFRLGF